MDKNLLTKHQNDPSWSEVIRLYSGLFDTQDEREDFILDLAETDILLAAECKTSSVEEEDRVLNNIILSCSFRYKKNKDAYSLLTLINLEEYWIVDFLLDENASLKISYCKLIRQNASITDFLDLIKYKIPSDVLSSLLFLIRNTGYKLDLNYYKSTLSLLNDRESIFKTYNDMKSRLIKPDLEIMNLFIKKAEDKNDILFFYKEMENHEIEPNANTFEYYSRKIKVYSDVKNLFEPLIDKRKFNTKKLSMLFIQAIKLAQTKNDSDFLFDKYCNLVKDNEFYKKNSIKVIQAYYISKISFSTDAKEANQYFLEAKNKLEKKIPFELIYRLLQKINSETEFNNYFEEYKTILLPDLTTLEEGQLEKTTNIYNSILFLITDRIENQINKYHETIQEINSSFIKLEPNLIKKIFIKFSISKFHFLLRNLLTRSDLDKSFFTSLVDEIPNQDDCIILFNEMKKAKFELNKILYNVFIKRISNIEFCIKIITEMRKNFTPDKFTYFSILQKKMEEKTFFIFVEMCVEDKIDIDIKFENLLYSIINQSNEIQQFYLKNSFKFNKKLSTDWFKLIETIINDLKEEKIVTCFISKIIHNRIFVKIENETSYSSIFIGELANEHLDNIFDFEYNGVKLHIGQKIAAKIINKDKLGRMNLSIRQLQYRV